MLGSPWYAREVCRRDIYLLGCGFSFAWSTCSTHWGLGDPFISWWTPHFRSHYIEKWIIVICMSRTLNNDLKINVLVAYLFYFGHTGWITSQVRIFVYVFVLISVTLATNFCASYANIRDYNFHNSFVTKKRRHCLTTRVTKAKQRCLSAAQFTSDESYTTISLRVNWSWEANIFRDHHTLAATSTWTNYLSTTHTY